MVDVAAAKEPVLESPLVISDPQAVNTSDRDTAQARASLLLSMENRRHCAVVDTDPRVRLDEAAVTVI